jgi:formylglycine-generating enzyme required for sulfatase activity
MDYFLERTRQIFILIILFASLSISACKSHQLGDSWNRPQDGMVLVYVPAGEFLMGSSKEMVFAAKDMCNQAMGKPAPGICTYNTFMDEYPDHPVELSEFWIDQFEVSNRQYRLCLEAGACDPPKELGSFSRDTYFASPEYDDHPVINLTYDMAAAYCSWVGARLPTEAEWEYAARGPEGFLFPWGNEFDTTKLNYCDSSCKGVSDPDYDDGFPDTAPVGVFPEGASWVGALDMAGNVREWVSDYYGYFPNEKVIDPQGPNEGDSWVSKGGSWYDPVDNIRSTNRGANTPDYWRHKLGFRCVSDKIR